MAQAELRNQNSQNPKGSRGSCWTHLCSVESNRSDVLRKASTDARKHQVKESTAAVRGEAWKGCKVALDGREGKGGEGRRRDDWEGLI